ncbi:hypothetical protein quinque_009048 [Culex quinquefasciatus]
MVNTMENSYATMSNISQHNSENFPELTPDQQKLLIELRRKKQEILLEIQDVYSHRVFSQEDVKTSETISLFLFHRNAFIGE